MPLEQSYRGAILVQSASDPTYSEFKEEDLNVKEIVQLAQRDDAAATAKARDNKT